MCLSVCQSFDIIKWFNPSNWTEHLSAEVEVCFSMLSLKTHMLSLAFSVGCWAKWFILCFSPDAGQMIQKAVIIMTSNDCMKIGSLICLHNRMCCDNDWILIGQAGSLTPERLRNNCVVSGDCFILCLFFNCSHPCVISVFVWTFVCLFSVCAHLCVCVLTGLVPPDQSQPCWYRALWHDCESDIALVYFNMTVSEPWSLT